jgi:Cyclopropane fatty acid synthase and related methyltransferases
MTDFDYDGYEKFLFGRLRGVKGLDLACGSGEMTVRMLKAGYTMTGVDISTEMLALAASKAKAAYKDVLLLNADLNGLKITKKYDFVISVCDGFNYVKNEKSLASLFCSVYKALPEGGLFIFDMSTEYKLRNIVGDNFFYEDGENLTYFWSNELHGNSVDMTLTFFEKQGAVYHRSDEYQTQYFYSNETILKLLKNVGFIAEVTDGKFKPLTDTSERIVVCAKKYYGYFKTIYDSR